MNSNSKLYIWYSYFNNLLSITGLATAVAAGLFHLCLLFLDFSRGLYNPYLNIWFHILLPPLVVVGFITALYGAWRERKKIKEKGIERSSRWSQYSGRVLLISVSAFALLLIPFLGFTTYTGYNYTDSVDFCGQACHEPMKPVFSAYQVSPHARVACSECHIGEGASWFARSKLSGTRQVFATLFDTFHRPIKTPIENLRPARETCERCHWPEKAFGWRVVDLPHYGSDEENTYRPLSMVLKTGGGDPDIAPVRGIHWHLLSTHKTEYVAVDEKRLIIPWVRVTTDDEVRVFRSDGLAADAPPPEGEFRVMDCLDCHNRPSHHYRTPDEILNTLISYGRVDASLPYFKRESTRLMAEPHESTPAARTTITGGLLNFYEQNYPEVLQDRKEALDSSIQAVLESFERNLFPEMKTDWRTHPDHIGHKYFPGCYRCHDDRHHSDSGHTIRSNCGLCHEFMEHKTIEGGKALVQGGYHHPYRLDESHEDLVCYACHDGGPTPPPTCDGCHDDVRDFMSGSLHLPGMATDFAGEPSPHYGELECIDCHEEGQAIPRGGIVPLCEDCHDEEYGLKIAAQLDRIQEEQDLIRNVPFHEQPVLSWREAMDLRAHPEGWIRFLPVHNPEYALRILKHFNERNTTASNRSP